MDKEYRSLFLYLLLSFGIAWVVMFAYAKFPNGMSHLAGNLSLSNPLIVFVMYLPTLVGLLIYQVSGGFKALKGIIKKLIPRKKDLFWFPLLFSVFAIFAAFIHYASLLFGLSMPKIDLSFPDMVKTVLINFFAEVGIIGGAFGWMGFLLPFLQARFKNNITAALLTGFAFGLWIAPEFLMFQNATSYLLYVIQLMALTLFLSYVFNATQGNLLIYLYAFWLAAAGSHVQLYYWNTNTQIFETAFLLIATIVIHFVFKIRNVSSSLQTFPNFIEINRRNEELLPTNSV